jgi:short-subunit dehydrogenase
MDSLGKALITGASSGIGAIYATAFAKRGYDLIVVARDKERLKAVLERISGDTNRSVEVMAADLTNAADLRRVEQALRTDATIELLVNNAGSAMNVRARRTIASHVRVAAIGGSDHTKVSSIPSSDRSNPAHLVSCV